MNNLDNKITEIMNKDVGIPEKFKTNIKNTINNCTNNTRKYNTLRRVKKIIIASLIGVSSLTVYAATTKNSNLRNMGFLKLSENYEENAVEINKTIENEYFTLTLESMAGDNAYIVAEYKIKLKEKAIEEFGEVPYNKDLGEYQLSFVDSIFVNSEKCNRIAHVEKISESEYYYSQVINVMDIKESNMNLELCFKSLYIGNYNEKNKIDVNKKIQLDVKANKTNKAVVNEQQIDKDKKVIIEGIFNTKFETYIKAQEITENITYGEYSGYHGVGTTYDSFVVANKDGNVIPYQVYDGTTAGKTIYVKDENGEMKEEGTSIIKESDEIKIVENFIIIIGKDKDLKEVKVTPIETSLYNDRNSEEEEAYNKAKWYKIVEGDTKYTAKSGLGGTFIVNRIIIDDENIIFDYEKQGLIGNEFDIIIRKNNGTMNYIHPSKTEIKGLDSEENRIIFSRYSEMRVGAIEGEYENISDVSQYEFTLLFGSKNKTIGEEVDLTIPEEDETIDTFKNVKILDTNS